MINTDRYNITNSRIISMILPFYARGRKIIMFLDAISYPISSIHLQFKKWALERLIESSITSQQMSLVWYLNYKFKSYFKNSSDTFQISTRSSDTSETIWYIDEYVYHTGTTPWMPKNKSEQLKQNAKKLVTRNFGEKEELLTDVLIYAPEIEETTFIYNETYINEIRKCIDKYLTVHGLSYTVIINKNSQ